MSFVLVPNCVISSYILEDGKRLDRETELIQLNPDDTDLDMTPLRIPKIKGFDILEQLKILGFRNNLIKKIENLHMLTTLKELELYDNQITEIETLYALVNLE